MAKSKQIQELIVFENDELIALNKPYGIPSLHERLGNGSSMLEMLRQYLPDAQLCHRLDRETSGILLAAKNPETYREMAIAFEQRKVQKEYLAVVHGRHHFVDTTVSLPLSVTSKGKAKVDKIHGKEACTLFNSLEKFRHFTLVACQPVTGRLHQIRIHLSALGAPIAADEAYGGTLPYLSVILKNYHKGRGHEMRPMIQRVALHALRIGFNLRGEHFQIESPLAPDMMVFLKLLRKNDSMD